MRRSRFAIVGSALVAAITLTAIAAPSAAATPAVQPTVGMAKPAYYLSLGDSLAFGYSDVNALAFAATAPSFDVTTFSGYTQALATSLGVQATNFSCPEETTTTMIHGQCQGMIDAQQVAAAAGIPLPASDFQHTPYTGPQLAAATAFLSHYRWWQRGIVTVSIGSDDVLPVAGACLGSVSCPALGPALKAMRTNLSTILTSLRRAAPLATIVVLAPYNPFGFAYPVSNVLALEVDLSIAGVALAHLDPVADAFTPINVTDADQHCTYVYYGCHGSADIHPTDAGYAVIAQAFRTVLP